MSQAPADLGSLPAGLTPSQQRLALAKIIKFGIPNTDMAGHEHLPDARIIALAEHVQAMRRTRSPANQLR
jgi:hypothetical protein